MGFWPSKQWRGRQKIPVEKEKSRNKRPMTGHKDAEKDGHLGPGVSHTDQTEWARKKNQEKKNPVLLHRRDSYHENMRMKCVCIYQENNTEKALIPDAKAWERMAWAPGTQQQEHTCSLRARRDSPCENWPQNALSLRNLKCRACSLTIAYLR